MMQKYLIKYYTAKPAYFKNPSMSKFSNFSAFSLKIYCIFQTYSQITFLPNLSISHFQKKHHFTVQDLIIFINNKQPHRSNNKCLKLDSS